MASNVDMRVYSDEHPQGKTLTTKEEVAMMEESPKVVPEVFLAAREGESRSVFVLGFFSTFELARKFLETEYGRIRWRDKEFAVADLDMFCTEGETVHYSLSSYKFKIIRSAVHTA